MVLTIYSLHAILAFTVNFSLALLILLDAPDRKENRLYFMVTLLFAFWSAGEALTIGSESSTQAYIGIVLIVVSIIYLPAYFLILSYKIPFDDSFLKFRWYLVALVFLVPTVSILLSTKFLDAGYIIERVSEPEKTFWIPLNRDAFFIILIILQNAAYIVISIYLLVKKLNSRRSMREKYGVMYLLTVVSIYFVLYILISTKFGGNNLILVLNSLLLMSSGLMNAHHIIGDKLINLRRFFRGGLRYSLISALIVSVYIFVIKTMAELYSSMYITNKLLIEFLIIFAFILFLNPVIDRAQSLLRRFLTMDFFKYKTKFLDFDKQISNIFSFNELVDKIRHFIESVFKPNELALLFLDDGKKQFVSRDGRISVPADSQIAEVLLETQQSIEITKSSRYLFGNAVNISDNLAGGVVVPYIIDNELRSMMILGSRSDKRIYNPDELDFLTVIYKPLGILMERNSLLKKIKDNEDKSRQMEKLASLGRMTAGIAHEFRNPLNVISIAAETIIRKKDDEQTVEEMLKYIIEEIEKLNNLVTDFLKLSKPSSPIFVTADLEPFLNSILDKAKSVNKNSDITVTKDIPPGLEITADFNLLNQAITNIVNNAYDIMGKSGGMHIKAWNENQKSFIEISDTGGGISDEHIHKIFDPFFTTKETGTGLGLSITHSSIESMGGELKVHNSEKGAVFTIILPENKNGQ
jgi:signal transduction histidine kinase